MYEDYYGLNGKPFNLTPDPRFLFLSEKHREAFAHLVYGIKNRAGFVMISGEVGTGKTTLCRSLLNQLDDDTDLAFIFNPILEPEELLRAINKEFGIETSASKSKDLVDELNVFLLERTRQGRNCVLVIDEAQDLDARLLEQIRLLSNLETETQKLIQIVLIGQPELAESLARPELRQLNQRITARYHLEGLSFQETLRYVAYRLRVAGGRRRVRFTQKAVRVVYRLSKGIPRVINSLCDRALLIGYTRDTQLITAPMIRQAGREIRGKKLRRPRRSLLRHAPASAVVLGAVFVAVAAGIFLTSSPTYVIDSGATMIRNTWGSVRDYLEPASESNLARMPAMEIAEASLVTSLEDADLIISSEVKDEATTIPATPSRFIEDAWFDNMEPRDVLQHGLSAVLGLWDVTLESPVPVESEPDVLGAFVEEQGLSWEWFNPTLEQMYLVNLPFLARVSGASGMNWVGVILRDQEGLTVVAGNGDLKVVREADFKARFGNEVLVAWKDPSPKVEVVLPWTRGEQVEALQKKLVSLGLLADPISGTYDGATIDAVRRVQRVSGIPIDGVSGRQTRMVLTSWLQSVNTPGLASAPSSFKERNRTLNATVVSDRSSADEDETQFAAVSEPRIELDVEENESGPATSSADEKGPEEAIVESNGGEAPLALLPDGASVLGSEPQDAPLPDWDTLSDKLPEDVPVQAQPLEVMLLDSSAWEFVPTGIVAESRSAGISSPAATSVLRAAPPAGEGEEMER